MVLVVGLPGAGKSTLCEGITRDARVHAVFNDEHAHTHAHSHGPGHGHGHDHGHGCAHGYAGGAIIHVCLDRVYDELLQLQSAPTAAQAPAPAPAQASAHVHGHSHGHLLGHASAAAGGSDGVAASTAQTGAGNASADFSASAAAKCSVWSPALWAQAHMAALHRARAALQRPAAGAQPALVLVDDNFYYTSMRRPYYVLAREARAAFVVLYVDASTADAVAADASRETGGAGSADGAERASARGLQGLKVGAAIIHNMAAKFEVPGHATWERRHTWNLPRSSGLSREALVDAAVTVILQQVKSGVAVPPAVSPATKEEEESGDAASSSLLHRCDVALRGLVGKSVSAVVIDEAGSANDRHSWIARTAAACGVAFDARADSPGGIEAGGVAVATRTSAAADANDARRRVLEHLRRAGGLLDMATCSHCGGGDGSDGNMSSASHEGADGNLQLLMAKLFVAELAAHDAGGARRRATGSQ